MSMRHKPGLVLVLAAMPFLMGATAILTATEVHAQGVPTYSAKFVCGSRGNDAGAVVRGVYATTVNIHNPWRDNPVDIRKKAVIALPQDAERGQISGVVTETLKSDEALGVDCQDIRALFAVAMPAFIEGFLVIQSSGPELNVVAVYTARHRTGADASDPNKYDVESVDVVEVHPKRVY